MAVNVGQRNVEDTPANRQLNACAKAQELCTHTIKICTKVYQCYNSWKAFAKEGNTFKMLSRMDKYFKELWGENDVVY